jgi:NADPH2:quinone reductase
VLVLGATGSVGRVAVQASKLRGAKRIIAAGRRRDALEEARELGADDVVELDGDLEQAFRDAFGGEGPTIVIDPLWGPPLVAALNAGAPGVRVVNVGQSAGSEATITSNAVRGKQAEIFGYSNYRVPRSVFRASYEELIEHAAAGRVRLDAETYPIERLGEAWERQANGPGAKLVVRFEEPR